MFKKIMAIGFMSLSFLYSANVNVNIQNTNWKLSAPNDNSVHVIYLPTTISLTDLQSSLDANQSLIIYNLAAYSDWMKVYNTSATPFIVAVKVTPNSIQYLTKVNGVYKSFNNYNDFVTYIKGLNLTPANGFSLDDYLSYFKEIKAGGVYYIKSNGDNLTFDINFWNSSNSSQTNSQSSSNSMENNSSSNSQTTSIVSETKPQVSSSNSNLQLPPGVPNVQ